MAQLPPLLQVRNLTVEFGGRNEYTDVMNKLGKHAVDSKPKKKKM